VQRADELPVRLTAVIRNLPVIRLVLVSPGQLALETFSFGRNKEADSCG